MSHAAPTTTRKALISAAPTRLLSFVVLWFVLTEGEVYGWLVAALAIAGATAASLALRPTPIGWSPAGLLRFVPFFLWQSVRGGTDVARRAFSPGLPIEPGIATVRLRLPTAGQRAILAATLGLLPGTLSVRLNGPVVTVHALNRRLPVEASVRNLETRLADVFAVPLND